MQPDWNTLQKYRWQCATSDFNTDNSAWRSLSDSIKCSCWMSFTMNCQMWATSIMWKLSTGVNVSSPSAATSCAVLCCFRLDQGWTNQPSEGPQSSRDLPGILAFLGESVCLHGRTENNAILVQSLGHRWVWQRKENRKKSCASEFPPNTCSLLKTKPIIQMQPN